MNSKQLWIVTLLGLFLVGMASAATQQQSYVQVMLSVKSTFELSVDRNIVDFKSMNPGEVKMDMPDNEGIKVNVKSNNGRPWYLKISDQFELSNGEDVIPNNDFLWSGYASKAATGVWHGKGDDSFSLTPALAYAAGVNEYNNIPNGTDTYFKFGVKVPVKQNSGIYRSIIAFTLTE